MGLTSLWGQNGRQQDRPILILNFWFCNADEGEPPTRKDKLLLDHNPHLLLEGMVIAAKAIGAGLGIIYIRGDYQKSIERVNEAIDAAKNAGWLGDNILGTGFDFDVHVFAGSGSYVAGCDTAMLESLEGKAAIPRPTPPYPTDHGLVGKPTVVNNVETLCNVPLIIKIGGHAFSSIGSSDCSGTKIFGLCGDIAVPGMYELPTGVSLQELIEMAGGVVEKHASKTRKGKLKAVSPGGVTTGLLTADEANMVNMNPTCLGEKDTFLGSGAVTIFNDQRNIFDFAEAVLDFLAKESCGNCVQCPIGIEITQRTLARARQGKAEPEEIQAIFQRSEMLTRILKCGLGKSSHTTVLSALRKFPEDLLAETEYYEKR